MGPAHTSRVLRPARLAGLLAFAACALGILLAPVAAAQTPPPPPPLTYVALGASDALGVGAADPAQEGWVPRFAGRLGPSTNVVNLGVYATLLNQAVTDQLPAAIAANPDVVTVWLAVNDFNALVPLDAYTADLDTLLRGLRANTRARILVGNVPDLSLLLRRDLDPRILQFIRNVVTHWNGAIAGVVGRNGATLVDLYGEWGDWQAHPEYVSSDGFHPSSAGYARLAEVFHGVYLAPVAAPIPAA